MSTTLYCISEGLFKQLDSQGLIPKEEGGGRRESVAHNSSSSSTTLDDVKVALHTSNYADCEGNEWINFEDKFSLKTSTKNDG